MPIEVYFKNKVRSARHRYSVVTVLTKTRETTDVILLQCGVSFVVSFFSFLFLSCHTL